MPLLRLHRVVQEMIVSENAQEDVDTIVESHFLSTDEFDDFDGLVGKLAAYGIELSGAQLDEIRNSEEEAVKWKRKELVKWGLDLASTETVHYEVVRLDRVGS